MTSAPESSTLLSRVEHTLKVSLAAEFVEIIDESHLHAGHAGARHGGAHFRATIVSSSFEGKSSVARHRAVYAALAGEMKAAIHALALTTFTPAEWQNK